MEEREAEAPSREQALEARNGFLMGLFLLALSGYIFVSGWFIPRPEGWLTAPAMLPLLLGGSLFVMAALITLDTIRQGALRTLLDFGSSAEDDGRPAWRIAFAMVAIGVFYFGLLPWLYFEVATALFLFVMIRIYWPEGGWGVRLAISVVLPFLVSGAFQGGFGIPLPGDSNVMQEFIYWLRH